MSKKTSLADYIDAPAAPAAGAKTTAKKPAKAGPEEVVQVAYRLPRTRWAKLRNLATNERSSVQAIITEALEAHFKRAGLPF